MSGINVQRVGERVLVTITEPQWSTPLSLLLRVEVAAELGAALMTMSSFMARDALDDRSIDDILADRPQQT